VESLIVAEGFTAIRSISKTKGGVFCSLFGYFAQSLVLGKKGGIKFVLQAIFWFLLEIVFKFVLQAILGFFT
jgi:hypothetical protein